MSTTLRNLPRLLQMLNMKNCTRGKLRRLLMSSLKSTRERFQRPSNYWKRRKVRLKLTFTRLRITSLMDLLMMEIASLLLSSNLRERNKRKCQARHPISLKAMRSQRTQRNKLSYTLASCPRAT